MLRYLSTKNSKQLPLTLFIVKTAHHTYAHTLFCTRANTHTHTQFLFLFFPKYLYSWCRYKQKKVKKSNPNANSPNYNVCYTAPKWVCYPITCCAHKANSILLPQVWEYLLLGCRWLREGWIFNNFLSPLVVLGCLLACITCSYLNGSALLIIRLNHHHRLQFFPVFTLFVVVIYLR